MVQPAYGGSVSPGRTNSFSQRRFAPWLTRGVRRNKDEEDRRYRSHYARSDWTAGDVAARVLRLEEVGRFGFRRRVGGHRLLLRVPPSSRSFDRCRLDATA
jgi:hypothetical protein